MPTVTLLQRIFDNCTPIPMSGCWIWMRGVNADGYGMLWHEGRMQYVHHITHDTYHGRPRKGFERDHTCKIRCCVNPDHLEAVSSSENAARGDWHKFCAVMPSKDYVPDYEVDADAFELA